MHYEKNIRDYLVTSGSPLLEALNKMNMNQARIIFIVQENGVALGCLSDGDFRRWITTQHSVNLNTPVDEVMNKAFASLRVNASDVEVATLIDDRRQIIPLLDNQGRVVSIARQNSSILKIGETLITREGPAYIIAEIGNNHNGSIVSAFRLIDACAAAGANCVKFQIRDLSHLYTNSGKAGEAHFDLGTQYTLDLLNKFQLSNDDLIRCFEYAKSVGLEPMCTPWDHVSLRVLQAYGLRAYKVASADLTNHELLAEIAASGFPLICSTGMSTEFEIKRAHDFLRELKADFALLHCNSTYPTPFKDVNLRYISRLLELYGCIVGYSGHERGHFIPTAAVALGARIIEKHITLDRNMEGADHKVSLLPDEFSAMVREIRMVEESLGHASSRTVSQGELLNRENLAKSLVAAVDIKLGTKIERSMILIRSPGGGLPPYRVNELIGMSALRDYRAGDKFDNGLLGTPTNRKSRYSFSRPYGIPVRYHDFLSLTRDTHLDLYEFHLSYHDLLVDPVDYLGPEIYGGQLVVHAPELFANDHLLDLASSSVEYRTQSLVELKRTVQVTNRLAKHFESDAIPPILVINAGGWSTAGFLPPNKKEDMYRRVLEGLSEVDFGNIQVTIQTMPPFPWHFGGQSHHNLFVDPDEIVRFFEGNPNLKVCLDVSHSVMACNYFNFSIEGFLRKVLPYTRHLHISDAKGSDGEGIQIGSGDVDFFALARTLSQYAPGVSFVPEIWQGHKNDGAGFWSALEFLEQTGL